MIEKNYELFLNALQEEAGKTPLSAPHPRLIAVSKGQPEAKIAALLAAGHRDFGENRWQEAKERWSAVRIQDSGFGIQKTAEKNLNPPHLHFIGLLQTNKVPEVVAFFDEIHSLDRLKLADALAKEQCLLPCYIQINTGEEPQKAGVMPKEAGAFIRYCRDERKLDIAGLMCVPPAGVNPAPHFAFLRQLAQRHDLKRLSMGMSGDWRAALRLGSTDIRIGTALFGERE